MKKLFLRSMAYIEGFSGKWWYGPLLGFLAAVDAYVVVISVEAFLLPAVIVRPHRWAIVSLWATIGSALGATSFAILASHYGESIINRFFPHSLDSESWQHASQYLTSHGVAGLAFISAGPFPQHIAVAVAGLAHMKTSDVFVAILIGRGLKYFFLSWAAIHSPKLLRKLRIIPRPT